MAFAAEVAGFTVILQHLLVGLVPLFEAFQLLFYFGCHAACFLSFQS